IAIIGVCFYLGAFQNSHQVQIFFDQRAFIFVVLGTLAASFLAYPYAVLSKTVDYILWGLLFRKKKQYLKVSQEIATARSSFLMNRSYVTMKESHPFLRECVTFLLNKNIKNEALDKVLHNRLEQFKQKYHEDYHVLKSIAKYPVAFGFVSALCGLVEMMQTGQNSWSYWASALVSIFWGVSFSYFVIWPLADSAYKAAHDDFTLRSLIVDGMMLIRERATDDHFQAYLRGYLSLNDRSEFKVDTSPNVYPFATAPKIENHEELDRHIDHSHHNEPHAEHHDLQHSDVHQPELAYEHHQPAPQINEPVAEAAEPAFVTLMAVSGDEPAVTGKKPKRPTDRELQESQRPNLIDQLSDKPNLSGHVEGSIRIDLDAHKKHPTFNFKGVRAEVKPEGKIRKS
ncbi:MAG: hypothetical protein K2P92_07960, partial [Bdellovibrionaceae bacterium]|nr:hypothetical protein [Pseudobdellovibrionaceae bacterium]